MLSKLCYDERCVSIRALNGVVCVCFVLCCVSLRRIALSYVVTALLRFVVLFCVTLCCGVLLCIVQHCFVLLCCVFLYISFKVSTSKLDVYSNNFHMWQSATQPFDNVLVPHCSDIDECTTGAAQCHYNATCVNIPGSFSCVCEPGYTGDGIICNGKLCQYCFYWKILILFKC